MSEILIVHAPSPLGLKPPPTNGVPGVGRAPHALRELGLHDQLRGTTAAEIAPPSYDFRRDPKTGLRNADGIRTYSRQLSDALAPLLAGGGFPLVLGGDCSIALGVADALVRSSRRFGLVYIDAHSDCQTPTISETGGIAGMPVAMITGATPNVMDPLDRASPTISPEDVVLLGVRDLFDVEGDAGGRRVVGNGPRVRDLDELRLSGPSATASKVLADLSNSEALWLHLEVDVLAPDIMPAVDSPGPGGLTELELTELLSTLLASPKMAGMHVTIYDPDRDVDRSAGHLLVRILTSALSVMQRERLDA